MPIKLDPALADLRSWKPRACSISKALEIVGQRSALLIMREAYFGTRRFDLFVERVGITEAVAAARLKQLTEAGLLRREPYKEPGSRTRHEYVLTDMGADLMPAVFALKGWGDTYLQEGGGPLALVEDGTGEPVRVGYLTEDGREVSPDDLRMEVRRRRSQS